jgi:hypothetical protein
MEPFRRAWPWKVTENEVLVVRTKLIVRAGCDLESAMVSGTIPDSICDKDWGKGESTELPTGARVVAVNTGECVREGCAPTRRVRVASVPEGLLTSQDIGWVTAVGSDGGDNLIPESEPAAQTGSYKLAKRALQRKLLEFWSKGAHGYSTNTLRYCRTLDLTSCTLVDDDGEALAASLSSDMRNLNKIELFGNRLGDRTLVALSSALAKGSTPCITHLQLGHNSIGDAGVKALAGALVGFEGFESLKIQLGLPPQDAISPALPRLEKLLLAHNAIGPAGAEHLAQAAEGGALKVLVCLGLSGNPICDGGVKAIAQVAKDDEVLPSLGELHLCDTKVTEAGVTALAETMLPKMGGLPRLRLLLVDEKFVRLEAMQATVNARTGQGGVHACKVQTFDAPAVATPEAPNPITSARAASPRVQASPRYDTASTRVWIPEHIINSGGGQMLGDHGGGRQARSASPDPGARGSPERVGASAP